MLTASTARRPFPTSDRLSRLNFHRKKNMKQPLAARFFHIKCY